jgi:hypothetical protein
MGKKDKKKNKDALEFVLVDRGIDDPNYNNPDAPSRVLLHVPKNEMNPDVQQKHDVIMEAIPEINRGVYNDDYIENNLKNLGVEVREKDMNKSDLIEKLDNLNMDDLRKVKLEGKGGKIEPVEEEIDTFKKPGEGKQVTASSKPRQHDDEGVGLFIPSNNFFDNILQENRFHTDVKPEEMNEEYKEVYDALKSDDEDNGVQQELEDDFILLANEGQKPKVEPDNNEVVLAEFKKEKYKPSYKFITKEEKEMLDKQFTSTYDKMYAEREESQVKPDKIVSKQAFDDAIDELIPKSGKDLKPLTMKYEDEGDYEDYEDDEDEEYEDFEDVEDKEDNEGSEEGEYKQFKIEAMTDARKKAEAKKPKGGAKFMQEEITLGDIDELIHNKDLVQKTIELFENRQEGDAEDEGYPQYFIEKKLDITSKHGRIGNLPKTISDKDESRVSKQKTDRKPQTYVIENTVKAPTEIKEQEHKDEKKMRKKLIKEENKEKRKQKKELKIAFQVIIIGLF